MTILGRPHGPFPQSSTTVNISYLRVPPFSESHTTSSLTSSTGAAGSDARPVRPLLAPRRVVVRRAPRSRRPRHPHITVRTFAGYPVVVLPIGQPPRLDAMLRAAVRVVHVLQVVGACKPRSSRGLPFRTALGVMRVAAGGQGAQGQDDDAVGFAESCLPCPTARPRSRDSWTARPVRLGAAILLHPALIFLLSSSASAPRDAGIGELLLQGQSLGALCVSGLTRADPDLRR